MYLRATYKAPRMLHITRLSISLIPEIPSAIVLSPKTDVSHVSTWLHYSFRYAQAKPKHTCVRLKNPKWSMNVGGKSTIGTLNNMSETYRKTIFETSLSMLLSSWMREVIGIGRSRCIFTIGVTPNNTA